MMRIVLLFAVWIGLMVTAAEKHVRSLQRARRLPLADLFVAPTPKANKKDNGKEMYPSYDGEDGGDDYYSTYYNYDDQYKADKKGGKMSMSGGKRGGKGNGSSYYYDDYYKHSPTHASRIPSPNTSHPTHPPKIWPPQSPDPPRGKGKGSGGMKSMGSKKEGKKPSDYPRKTYPPNYYNPSTRSPSQEPPSPTSAPVTPTPPTPTQPTPPTPTQPTPPTPPIPSPPPTSVPVLNPSTAAPTSVPGGGGPTVIQLTDFSLEYDIAPVVIPPISDIEAVEAVTTDFLREVFTEDVPGLLSLGLNYVGEDLAFPTYTIDYEVVATVSQGNTKEELDAVLDSAFQGARLQQYLELIQALPQENSFSRATGIRKIATPQARNADINPQTRDGNDNGQLPVPLLAAAGAASFALIMLGIALNRREKRAKREGKANRNHRDHMTVAGDTYAGETFAETINSAASKGGISQSSSHGGRLAGYETAVRPYALSSSDSDGGYVTESDYESGYEEEKVEIEDDKSLSNASFSRYGGVVPVVGEMPNGEGESMDSTIRSGASVVESNSAHSRLQHSTDSGSTSIHILEAVSSDDDDLKRASQTRHALDAYYSRPGEIQIQIPSVETDDYEEMQDAELLYTGVGRRDNAVTEAQRSFKNIANQLGEDLQRELKREPEQIIPERQPDPPEEASEELFEETSDSSNKSATPQQSAGKSGVAELIQRFN